MIKQFNYILFKEDITFVTSTLATSELSSFAPMTIRKAACSWVCVVVVVTTISLPFSNRMEDMYR